MNCPQVGNRIQRIASTQERNAVIRTVKECCLQNETCYVMSLLHIRMCHHIDKRPEWFPELQVTDEVSLLKAKLEVELTNTVQSGDRGCKRDTIRKQLRNVTAEFRHLVVRAEEDRLFSVSRSAKMEVQGVLEALQ